MSFESHASSPFFHRGPIHDSRYFYGRSAETGAVLSLLAQMQNCSVAGPIKIGKTSFLLHLTRPEVWRAHGLDPDRYALVYLTFEELLAQTAEQVFDTMAREAVRAAMPGPFAGGPPSPPRTFALHEVRQSMAGLTRGGRASRVVRGRVRVGCRESAPRARFLLGPAQPDQRPRAGHGDGES